MPVGVAFRKHLFLANLAATPFQCYGATRPQDGRSVNEDAFTIHPGPAPYAALADGAGNADVELIGGGGRTRTYDLRIMRR